jgi:predicted transposase YdaD
MSFDNICKYLSEQYPERFAAWLSSQPSGSVDVLKTELSVEPIRADFVAF